MILIPRKYNIRPNGHLEIDWSNEHTASLIAVLPMNRLGSMNNLVTGEEPLYLAGSFTDKTTTEGSFAGFNNSADYVTYDPLSNHGIVDSTPVTIAWQQTLDSNGVYLMSPFSWMPSGLTRSFAITTSATGAGGAVQYGMTIGTENGSTTTNAGFGQVITGRTVGVHEKFVVVCTEGMHTTNAKNSHWLYRNGIKIAQPTVGYNLANATTVGLKVGNTIQAPSWPMIGSFGEICIWKRAKSQDEITDYNANPYQIYKANSNRVYFDFTVASGGIESRTFTSDGYSPSQFQADALESRTFVSQGFSPSQFQADALESRTFTSQGFSPSQFQADALESRTFVMDGSSLVDFIPSGASTISRTFTSDGVAIAAFISDALESRTFNSAGFSPSQFQANALESRTFNSSGVSTPDFIPSGASTVSRTFTSDGSSLVTFVSATIQSRTFNSSGVAAVDFIPSGTTTVSRTFNSSGAGIASFLAPATADRVFSFTGTTNVNFQSVPVGGHTPLTVQFFIDTANTYGPTTRFYYSATLVNGANILNVPTASFKNTDGPNVSLAVGAPVYDVGWRVLHTDSATVSPFELKVSQFRPKPDVPLQYMPGICPFTANYINGENVGWRGPVYTGYQDPNIWDYTSTPGYSDKILDFLLASQAAYTAARGLTGPFAPVYILDRYDSVSYAPVGTFTWNGPDPNTEWEGYQVRPLEATARYLYHHPTNTKALQICTDFMAFLNANFNTVLGFPTVYPSHSAPSATYFSAHALFMILRASVYMTLAEKDTGPSLQVAQKCVTMAISRFTTEGIWGQGNEDWFSFWNGEILSTLALIKKHNIPLFTNEQLDLFLNRNLGYLNIHTEFI